MKKPGLAGPGFGMRATVTYFALLLLLPMLRSLDARLLRLLASPPLRPASLRLILVLPLLAWPRLPRLLVPALARLLLLRLVPDDDFEDAIACSCWT